MDGYMSASIFSYYAKSKNLKVSFKSFSYGQTIEDKLLQDTAVVIVDVCLPPEQMKYLASKDNTI